MMPRVLLIFMMCAWAQRSGLAAEPAAQIAPPPLPPSPIAQFRQWLSVPAAERQKALAEWPAAKRAVIEEKLASYQALAPEQRELRLNMLELRWYLRPLLSLPREQRSKSLEGVPPPLRPLVEDRLERWDRLAPATQREIVENEDARELVATYFAQINRGTRLRPRERERLDQSLRVLNDRSLAERRRIAGQVAEFFNLSNERQSRALDHFSEAERQEMEQTLEAFTRLSPAERRVCVDSFQKFASLSDAERREFLRNAMRWQSMTPQERETWKTLVTKLPPMPPETDVLPPPPRPVPVVSNNPPFPE